MRELIYYPSFEIYDENWLKFSLLYFNTIRPIIPYSNEKGLSDTYHLIKDSTKFYEPLHPDYSMDTVNASRDAVELVNKILQSPYDYDNIFKCVNIVREWQNPENFSFQIYSGKYSYEWEKLIEEYKIGIIAENFMMIDPRLGQLYMTIFAHVVSDIYGIPLITDKSDIHKFSMLTRSRNQIGSMKKEAEKVKFTEKVIDIQLPIGLDKIPLQQIIQLRNDKEFATNLMAYHMVISEMQEYNRTQNAGELVEKYRYTFNKFGDGLISAGFKIAKWAVKYFNPENVVQDAEDLFEASSAGHETYTILSNSWTKSKVKRHTQKYLFNIKELTST